jgi:hypothetical protein
MQCHTFLLPQVWQFSKRMAPILGHTSVIGKCCTARTGVSGCERAYWASASTGFRSGRSIGNESGVMKASGRVLAPGIEQLLTQPSLSGKLRRTISLGPLSIRSPVPRRATGGRSAGPIKRFVNRREAEGLNRREVLSARSAAGF